MGLLQLQFGHHIIICCYLYFTLKKPEDLTYPKSQIVMSSRMKNLNQYSVFCVGFSWSLVLHCHFIWTCFQQGAAVGPGKAGLLWDTLTFLQASPLVKHMLLVAFVISFWNFRLSFKDNVMQKNAFNDQSRRERGLLFRRSEQQMLSVPGNVEIKERPEERYKNKKKFKNQGLLGKSKRSRGA